MMSSEATDSLTMLALKRDAENKTVKLVNRQKPTRPQPGHVIIKVCYGGICGTDLHIMSGKINRRHDLILGHEISGVVDTVGDNVTTLKPGAKVVVVPQVSCGECTYCQRGGTFWCVHGALQSAVGWEQDGGWRQFWELPAKQVVALASDIPLSMGVLCEPFCCVYQGWQLNRLQPQDAQILIMGAGIIGLLWANLFHLRGYTEVSISEPNEHRKELARGLQLGYRVCDPAQITNKMAEIDTERDGFDLIVDCSGNTKAIENSLCWLRRGGTLNLFGIPPSGAKVVIDPLMVILRSITIVGTLIGPDALPCAVPTFTALARKGYLDFDKLGIEVYPFKEYQCAIDVLKCGTFTKAVLDIGGHEVSLKGN